MRERERTHAFIFHYTRNIPSANMENNAAVILKLEVVDVEPGPEESSSEEEGEFQEVEFQHLEPEEPLLRPPTPPPPVLPSLDQRPRKNPKFPCGRCDHVSSSRTEYQRHNKTHVVWVCERCFNLASKERFSIRRHQRRSQCFPERALEGKYYPGNGREFHLPDQPKFLYA